MLFSSSVKRAEPVSLLDCRMAADQLKVGGVQARACKENNVCGGVKFAVRLPLLVCPCSMALLRQRAQTGSDINLQR